MAVAQREAGLLGEAVLESWPLGRVRNDLLAAPAHDDLLELARRLDAADEADALVLQRPRTLPPGAVVFWARRAATTSVTEIEYSRSFSACSSTDNSRRSEPLTLTVATPGMPLNWSAKVVSARREIAACVCLVDDKANCTIGCAAGSTRVSTGSRISVGSLWRTLPDRVAHLVGGLDHVLVEVEDQQHPGVALAGRRTHLVDAGNRLQRLLDRLIELALHRVGRRAGYGMVTTSTGCSTSGSG
jgi:hypothetical protein